MGQILAENATDDSYVINTIKRVYFGKTDYIMPFTSFEYSK